jgi:hypothetical protein
MPEKHMPYNLNSGIIRNYVKVYASANLLLSLRSLPHFHSAAMSRLQITMRPANRLTPPSMPMPRNIGLEKRMAAMANKLLERLLAEKMLAAYRG